MTPRPAVIHCTSPGLRSPLFLASPHVSAAAIQQVDRLKPRWGWSGAPTASVHNPRAPFRPKQERAHHDPWQRASNFSRCLENGVRGYDGFEGAIHGVTPGHSVEHGSTVSGFAALFLLETSERPTRCSRGRRIASASP